MSAEATLYQETVVDLMEWADFHAGDLQIERAEGDMMGMRPWRVTMYCVRVWGPAMGEDAACDGTDVVIEANSLAGVLRIAKVVWDAAESVRPPEPEPEPYDPNQSPNQRREAAKRGESA